SLLCHYGTEIDTIVAPLMPASPGTIAQQELMDVLVRHAVQQEMACTLSDVIFRRTGLGTIGHPGRDALERIAMLMAELLGWDQARIRSEVEEIENAYRCLRP
ncbi:MAG: glycerol-3-phosphate dehydrogenase C-terminal domain-containing protein, partial [Desulfobulbaceae bacterium]